MLINTEMLLFGNHKKEDNKHTEEDNKHTFYPKKDNKTQLLSKKITKTEKENCRE